MYDEIEELASSWGLSPELIAAYSADDIARQAGHDEAAPTHSALGLERKGRCGSAWRT